MSSISFSAKVVGFTAVCCAVAAAIEIPRAHQNLLDIEAAWKLLEEGGRVVTDVGDKLKISGGGVLDDGRGLISKMDLDDRIANEESGWLHHIFEESRRKTAELLNDDHLLVSSGAWAVSGAFSSLLASVLAACALNYV